MIFYFQQSTKQKPSNIRKRKQKPNKKEKKRIALKGKSPCAC